MSITVWLVVNLVHGVQRAQVVHDVHVVHPCSTCTACSRGGVCAKPHTPGSSYLCTHPEYGFAPTSGLTVLALSTLSLGTRYV